LRLLFGGTYQGWVNDAVKNKILKSKLKPTKFINEFEIELQEIRTLFAEKMPEFAKCINIAKNIKNVDDNASIRSGLGLFLQDIETYIINVVIDAVDEINKKNKK